jgi:hypothetical protein
MSGLWLRSQLNAGQDGFRDGNSKQPVDQQRPLGLPECFAPWIDRSHHLSSSCKFWRQLSAAAVELRPAPR